MNLAIWLPIGAAIFCILVAIAVSQKNWKK